MTLTLTLRKGHIRIAEENDAKNLLDKMSEANLFVKEKEITVKPYEGDNSKKMIGRSPAKLDFKGSMFRTLVLLIFCLPSVLSTECLASESKGI